MRIESAPGARVSRFSHATCPAIAIAVALGSTPLLASTGATLPLNQYQAGTETVNNSLVVNGNFEQPGTAGPDATGWTPENSAFLTPAMSVGTPDQAHLPNPASVLGSFSAKAGVSNINANEQYTQPVTLDQNTEYVLSSYMWAYGIQPLGAFGDFVGVELVDNNNTGNTASLFIEPTLRGGAAGSGAGGAFVYQSFHGSQFPNGASLQVRSDPYENNPGSRPSVIAQWDNVAITPLSEFRAQVWTSAAGGTWGDNARWRNTHANADSAIATFSNQAGPVTVTIDADKRAGVVQFDSTGSYTIAGTNKLTLAHESDKSAVILQVLRGSHTISAPVVIGETSAFASPDLQNRMFKLNIASGSTLTVSGTISSSGTKQFNVEKLGAGRADVKSLRAKNIQISAGTLGLIGDSGNVPIIRGSALGMGSTAKLDLRNGIGIVDYAPADPSPLAALQAEAAAHDIYASSAANNLAVGVVEASTIGASIFGEPVDATAVALISTFRGDSNLDRDVDFDDLLLVAQFYGVANPIYAQGDGNYSGTVDFDDLLAVAQSYGKTFSLVELPAGWSPTGSFDTDWQFARSIVPEPTMLSPLACGVFVRRRR